MHDSIYYTDVYIYIYISQVHSNPSAFIDLYILKVDGLEWTCDDRINIYINIYLSYHAKNNAQNAIASESIAHGHI